MKMNKKDPIEAKTFFPGLNWDNDVKIHIAQRSGTTQPIEVFTRSFDEWQNVWNGSWHSNHCWNRKYIFTVIELPTQPNKWLFGGIFKVLSHSKRMRKGRKWSFYKVALEPVGKALIGRLVLNWEKDARAKGRKPDTVVPNMTVAELLPEPYSGEKFPGYENINHKFYDLEKIWNDKKPDWHFALVNCQGVYLITDTKTGRRYVGSAYGDGGIWSRWETYFRTSGHGNNVQLKELLESKVNAIKYARNHLVISLLEHISNRANEQDVISRECFWKEVLLARGKFGLCRN